MNINNKIIDIVGYGLMTLALTSVLTACPDDKSSEETGPASSVGDTSGSHASSESESGTSPAPAPSERPESMPLLCSLDSGKWCTGCPQGNSGPLCCIDAACVPWDAVGETCGGAMGWCNSYTLTEDPKAEGAAPKLATCHDD